MLENKTTYEVKSEINTPKGEKHACQGQFALSTLNVQLCIPIAINANERLRKILQSITYFVGFGGPVRSCTMALTGTMVTTLMRAITIITLAY
jgi:hypothetical protein